MRRRPSEGRPTCGGPGRGSGEVEGKAAPRAQKRILVPTETEPPDRSNLSKPWKSEERSSLARDTFPSTKRPTCRFAWMSTPRTPWYSGVMPREWKRPVKIVAGVGLVAAKGRFQLYPHNK